MIIERHYPQSMAEAVELLSRVRPRTLPFGAGTRLPADLADDIAVVDLQGLNLSTITVRGNVVALGATVSRLQLNQDDRSPRGLSLASQAELQAGLPANATLGGTIASSDGGSVLLSALLALDAEAHLEPGSATVPLGSVLALRSSILARRLITGVAVAANVIVAARQAKSPSGQAGKLTAAVARWPSGRVRAVLGGTIAAPVLVFDGPSVHCLGEAVSERTSQVIKNANHDTGRAAAELINACLRDLKEQESIEKE